MTRCAIGSPTSADSHYVLGSAMGPHPYPTIVRDFQRVIGDEAAAQIDERRRPAAGRRRPPAWAAGRMPLACSVGSSANQASDWSRSRPPAKASRPATTPRRWGRQHGHHPRRSYDAPAGPRRPGDGGALDLRRARLPGRWSAAFCAGLPRAGWSWPPRPTRRRSAAMRTPCTYRGHPAGARTVARASRPCRAYRRLRLVRSCCWDCPAAATRTSATWRSRHDARHGRLSANSGQAFASAREQGRLAFMPVRRRRLPGRCRRQRRSPWPPSTPVPTCSRSACPTPIRWRTASPCSARARPRWPMARTLTGRLSWSSGSPARGRTNRCW